MYDDGHLVEIAVFEPGELRVRRVNAFRVLHDTGDVTAWITALASTTTATQAAADPDGTERFAAFVQQMIVGINRNARGEHVSANARVRGQALELLLSLLRDSCAAEPDAAVDNLDPHRRFELAHPEIGRRLVTALDGPLDALIHELVAVFEEHVSALTDRFVVATRRPPSCARHPVAARREPFPGRPCELGFPGHDGGRPMTAMSGRRVARRHERGAHTWSASIARFVATWAG